MPAPVDRSDPSWISRNDLKKLQKGSYKMKKGPKLTRGANKRSRDGPLKIRDVLEMVKKYKKDKVPGNIYDKIAHELHVSPGNISRWVKNGENIYKQAGEIEAVSKNL